MKRMLSLLLALAMCLSLSVPAWAVEIPTPTSLSPATLEWIEDNSTMANIDLRQQVVSDFESLSSVGILSDFCTPYSIRSDGKIVYDLQLTENITNQITTHWDTQNQLVVEFYEDDKHDTVVYLNNGSLLVNGCLIDNHNSVVSFASSSGNVTIQPRARYDDFSLSPWGSASEYTIDAGVYTGSFCSWGVETIANLSIGAVAAIICDAVKAKLGLAILITIFSTVASNMINYTTIYGMEDAYYSWEFSVHKRQGSFILEDYYEYEGACWSRRNLQGTEFEHTFYRRNYFS